MKNQILIGMMVTTSLLASCAAEPEERAPAPATENTTTSVGEPEERLGPEADTPGGDGQVVVEAETEPHPIATAPELAGETPADDPGEVIVGEPGATDSEDSELPEPGGPWVDPREPDFTKTVPPPRD